jgi:cardiolipin synthase
MENWGWVATVIYTLDLLLRLGISLRVIMRRLPVGMALAWLAVILILPFAGVAIYLLIGEYRLGWERAKRASEVRDTCNKWLQEAEAAAGIDPDVLQPSSAALARLAETVLCAPVFAGNRLELLDDSNAAFDALIADVDAAKRTCYLEFYIWSMGGRANDLGQALLRAAKRGVTCHVLLDAIGGVDFLTSGFCQDLRDGGVLIQPALPANLLRVLFVRPDLRLHRKIVIIDGEIGYTGSMNIADPRWFKQEAEVGQWVDAMVRVRGPVVRALSVTFLEDWAIETGEPIEKVRGGGDLHALAREGPMVVQALPSGPDARVDGIAQVILAALYAAREEVVLTTPYFIPDEPLLTALLSAPARGVRVVLIVPARIDSYLVQFASRSYQTDLLKAGVQVALYQDGLLHTKSITVDGRLSLFGSVNLDPRSLRLDFEITLAVYNAEFTADLRRLQQHYLDRSELLDLATLRDRPPLQRLAENAARLAGPVL